jgi:acyl-coenzyme A thioesterase PaaI-like protein
MGILDKLLPASTKQTLYLRYFGLRKIPLLFYVRPSVILCTDEQVVIRIPLCRRTENHQGSMYFAALAIGADCSVGLLAVELIHQQQENISFIFKDFNAEFLRRANGDVYFSCDQGREIRELVQQAVTGSERVELPLNAIATVPAESDEPVARFRLTLSLKRMDR